LARDEQVIAARLSALEENLNPLARFSALDVSAFTSDPRNYGAAERFLHLAMDAVFDIGTHCLAARGLRRPSTYGDILPALADAEIIHPETAEALRNMAGFRNLLVPDYIRIDHARVHLFLRTRLDGLRQFAADIATFVFPQPPPPPQGL
jgi:uncharacterized protein YutE (UPF0331/DUF86 family)